MKKPETGSVKVQPPKQKRRKPEISAREFTAAEKAKLEEILSRLFAKHQVNRYTAPQGVIRAIEIMVLKYGKNPMPLVTSAEVREKLSALLDTTRAMSLALNDAKMATKLTACPLPEGLETDLTNVASEVEKQLGRLGHSRHVSHPADGLAIRLRAVLHGRGIAEKFSRGSLGAKILRIVFDAGGLGNVSDPTQYVK